MEPRANSPVKTKAVQCDVVIPVYNSLSFVKECIESVLKCSAPIGYQLYLIDDCSDSYTRSFLISVSREHSHVSVHTNTHNIGFVKSCNKGVDLGRAPYVLLLNSDVVVTPGWLYRILECAESDPHIGSVNPLTNQASKINLPMAPGANFMGMDLVLKGKSTRRFPDVVTGVGFCLLLRRTALEQVGKFDEIYGRGYCEESDLCMRLTNSGWRTVVADHVYVYHKGRGTFRDSGERYRDNRAIFDSRWKGEYERQYRVFLVQDPLASVRGLFQTRQRWEPMPVVWEAGRAAMKAWTEHNWGGAAHELMRGGVKVIRHRRQVGTPESVAAVTRPNRLRVTYVLRDIVVAGGVLSVIQLVNELILLGVEARIVATFEDPIIYNWARLYTRPIVFKSERELVNNFPETDIAIATLWSTAPLVTQVVADGKARHAAYFVQDYEPWFFPKKNPNARRRVKDTYSLIEHRIVKSDWLKDMLARDGFSAHKIRLGMDLSRFYPRDAERDRWTVLAMARPGTPRRGFGPTIEALAGVKRAAPEVKIVLFGAERLNRENIPFEFEDRGIVDDHDQLAQLYSEADVFLEGSDFQGFGRCGLEAMACETACVLTSVGGVTEYAKHGDNALLVPPGAPNAFADAILRLLHDADGRQAFAYNGRMTAQEYCHTREAKETLVYLSRIAQ